VTFINAIRDALPRTGHTRRIVTTLHAADVVKIAHLGGVPAAEAAALARELVVRDYPAREFVAIEGEPCPGFFQLLTGRARLYRTAPDGREQIMRLLQPGDTFGEVAVFDGGPTPATIETIEPSRAVLIPSSVFRALINRHPEVALDLLAHFAGRLRSFTELVEQISLQTVQQRLARYLYLAAREDGRDTPAGIVVPRSITLQDLASFVGSVREVVSRTLHAMEVDGVVEVRRREIVVRDMDALRKLL
jgi:CRP/FNR family transcriptional regulator